MVEFSAFPGIWRGEVLARTYAQLDGGIVKGGLFAGMALPCRIEGALIPKLLGTCETELPPIWRRFAETGVDCIIDIGCAEGFCAAGLARLLREVAVYAYDTDPAARESGRVRRAANGVSERDLIGGEFKPTDFDAFRDRKTLVICDTEALSWKSCSPTWHPPSCSDAPRRRDARHVWTRCDAVFLPTHTVEVLNQQPRTTDLPH